MADIGHVGFAVEVADDGGHRHDAAELEKLGYSALWLPGGQLDRPDRVLDLLAATRSVAIGTAVLLVTPDYVRSVRASHAGASVVVTLMVVLDGRATRARETARGPLGFLTGLPGYQAHLARLGYADDQVRDLDDALVDDLVAWGSPAAVAERVGHLREAGADHVFLQVVYDGDQPAGVEAARQLAPAFF